MNIRAALKGQYHAALNMLKQTVEQCPDEMWDSESHSVSFWQVAYHALYFTHLYLLQNEEVFLPWEKHRHEYHYLPWPPGSGSKIDNPYTKAELLEYWRLCDASVDADVDRLDLDAAESGFSWHKTIPKLEHQLHNIRHIQHHAALLSGRLRLNNGTDVRWVRSHEETYEP